MHNPPQPEPVEPRVECEWTNEELACRRWGHNPKTAAHARCVKMLEQQEQEQEAEEKVKQWKAEKPKFIEDTTPSTNLIWANEKEDEVRREQYRQAIELAKENVLAQRERQEHLRWRRTQKKKAAIQKAKQDKKERRRQQQEREKKREVQIESLIPLLPQLQAGLLPQINSDGQVMLVKLPGKRDAPAPPSFAQFMASYRGNPQCTSTKKSHQMTGHRKLYAAGGARVMHR